MALTPGTRLGPYGARHSARTARSRSRTRASTAGPRLRVVQPHRRLAARLKGNERFSIETRSGDQKSMNFFYTVEKK
jgi:hypothetical protein